MTTIQRMKWLIKISNKYGKTQASWNPETLKGLKKHALEYYFVEYLAEEINKEIERERNKNYI